MPGPLRPASLKKAAAAFLAALVLSPAPLFAWSGNGHRVVALIAKNRLSVDARKGLEAILGPVIGLEWIAPCADYLRGKRKSGVEEEDEHMDDVPARAVNCGGLSWDEEVRSGPWHYIDIPITESPSDASGLKPHCPDSDCVVDQVHADIKVLQDPSASRRDKQIALMFLVHFAGDLHQPLHAATEYVDDVDDRGGNLKWVIFMGAKLKLHALWDHILEPKDTVDPVALSALLEKDLAGKDTAPWKSGDFVAGAALEAFAIAKTVVYPSYYSEDTQNLGADHQSRMQPIAYEQLEKAGVRLAALLETALTRTPVMTAPPSRIRFDQDLLRSPF